MALSPAIAREPEIGYILQPFGQDVFVLDIRDTKQCKCKSLKGARCIPANDFLDTNQNLVGISGLLWLLGTIGLSGVEHVVVVGNDLKRQEFVAGVLFIAGQKRISILEKPIEKIEVKFLAGGEERSTTREKVFISPMRDGSLILPEELDGLIQTQAPYSLLEVTQSNSVADKYARPLINTAQNWSGDIADLPPVDINAPIIVYGRDTSESLAALARLVARNKTAMALLGGAKGWNNRHVSSATGQPLPGIFAMVAIVVLVGAALFFVKLRQTKGA